MLNKMFQSVIDQDRAGVVICNLEHEIVYMNPASREMIDKVIHWFMESEKNNMIYTFHNEKQNKDVYMVALRDSEQKLIGYYEKHEYRDRETAKRYDFTKSLV